MAETKELRRNTEAGMITGVCAGMADYFEIDVALVRVLFILFVFITSGVGILIYFLLALVVPAAETTAKSSDIGDNVQSVAADVRKNISGSNFRNTLGVTLIVIGGLLLIDQFVSLWVAIRWELVWPIILIVIGVWLLFRRTSREE